jgi:hypothetical protein
VRYSRGTDSWGHVRAELRLRILRSLPPKHQRYLFAEMRKLCRDFLRNQQITSSETTPEELLSEVWQKLLGTASVQNEEMPDLALLDPSQISIDADVPERDGRVVWLIDQIGGSEALAHRREDILRRRFGRAPAGSGRRMVQPLNEDEFHEIVSDGDTSSALDATDGLRVWRGLLTTANLQFQHNDDLSMLLQLLARNPDILQISSGGQWPIANIVAELNKQSSPPLWTDDRVDNAKRRLLNWIKRLKQKNGLDDVDLEALFARVARQEERGNQSSPSKPDAPLNLQH